MKLIKIIIFIIVLLSLGVYLSLTNFEEVGSNVQEIGIGFVGLLCLSFGSYLFGSIAWKYCFENTKAVSIFQLFFIRTIGENITLFNPTNLVAGEASKYYLLKGVELSQKEKLDSILFSRVVLISSQLFLSLICLFYVGYTNEVLPMVVLSIIGLGSFIYLVGFAFSFLPKLLQLSKGHRLHRNTRLLKVQGIRTKMRFYRFLKNRKRQVLIVFLCSLIHWLFGAGEIYLIVTSLGLSPSFIDSLTVDIGVVWIKSIGGFVPGQLGIEELGNKWMLALTGVTSASVWITVSILRRGKQLFWIGLSVLFYFLIKRFRSFPNQVYGDIIYNS